MAKQFLLFLASPEAAAAIKKSGMQPASEQLTTTGNSGLLSHATSRPLRSSPELQRHGWVKLLLESISLHAVSK
jgi:hypothetical protein